MTRTTSLLLAATFFATAGIVQAQPVRPVLRHEPLAPRPLLRHDLRPFRLQPELRIGDLHRDLAMDERREIQRIAAEFRQERMERSRETRIHGPVGPVMRPRILLPHRVRQSTRPIVYRWGLTD
jgi:hypothetical protein